MTSKQFTDQMGRLITISFPPKRIISLVPSQTELLFELELDQEIIGITKFCIHPRDKFKTKPKVGGTKKLNMKMIRELKPDLIIGNKEENEQSQIEELMNEFPVWMSDINELADAVGMITGIGKLTGKSQQAELISFKIMEGFNMLNQSAKSNQTVAYFIWKDPFMVAGRNTFIHDILNKAGYENFTKQDRYPVMSMDEIKKSNPDLVFLSSEPYPFKDVHVVELKSILPSAKVMVVDGEMFSWYGSRLLQSPAYLQKLADLTN